MSNTLVLNVRAEQEDLEQRGASSKKCFKPSDTTVLGNTSAHALWFGMRFEHLNIPRHSVILEATLEIYVILNTAAETWEQQFYYENSNTPAAFAETENNITARTLVGSKTGSNPAPNRSALRSPLAQNPTSPSSPWCISRLRRNG